MKLPSRRRRLHAFSLIEVSIAMGIFGFAIVVILGLMGSALKSTRDSEERIAASNLAATLLARYQGALQNEADGGGSSGFSWSNFPLPETPDTAVLGAPENWNSKKIYVDGLGNTVSGPNDDDAAFALNYIATQSGIGTGIEPLPTLRVVRCSVQLQWPPRAADAGKAVNSYTATTSFVISARK